MVLGSASQPPLAPLPTSAAPSLKEELAEFVPPYTTKSYGEPPFPPALPLDIWNDLIKSNPHYATQTMSTTDPATHRLGTNAQISTSDNYEADLTKMKAGLATLLRTELGQLGLSPSRNRLYQ